MAYFVRHVQPPAVDIALPDPVNGDVNDKIRCLLVLNAYLVDYRLKLAAKQLSGTDYRIIDVTENCGFHNHSYFTRAFREKYQMTPTEYRRVSCMGKE